MLLAALVIAVVGRLFTVLSSLRCAVIVAVFVTVFITVFIALLVVETGDAILLGAICRLLNFRYILLALKLLDLAACAVGCDNLSNA